MVSTSNGQYQSRSVRGWALDNLAPAKVQLVKASVDTDFVVVEWNPVRDNDVDYYLITRVDENGNADMANPIATTSDSEIQLNKNELPDASAIRLVVLAVDVHNNVGQASNPVDIELVTSLHEHSSSIPESLALSQNYPNPFNPSTTISFALPESGQVNLTIYNMMGQRVKSVVSTQMQAGYHSVKVDASQLSSGFYIYTLSTSSGTLSKKMLLVK
jgi:hypothetical protein